MERRRNQGSVGTSPRFSTACSASLVDLLRAILEKHDLSYLPPCHGLPLDLGEIKRRSLREPALQPGLILER